MSDVVPGARSERFPGFRPDAESEHWDAVTTGAVLERIGMPPDIRFFTPAEEAVGTALCDQLLGQHSDDHQLPPSHRADRHTHARPPGHVPVLNMIDARLAQKESDGWRYEDMPHDGEAWRRSLVGLNDDARNEFATDFALCGFEQQASLVQAVQDLGSRTWHGLRADHVWSLWTRYACTAFYAHPSAWAEIGFPGPAYPRGYKNVGVDALEPFEVADAHPEDNPAREQR